MSTNNSNIHKPPRDPRIDLHSDVDKNAFYESTNLMFSPEELDVIYRCIDNKKFIEALQNPRDKDDKPLPPIHKIEKGCTLTVFVEGEPKTITLKHSLIFDRDYKRCFSHHHGAIGEGSFGRAKIVQDVRTGELGVNKVVVIKEAKQEKTFERETSFVEAIEGKEYRGSVLRTRRTKKMQIVVDDITLKMPWRGLKTEGLSKKAHIFQPLFFETLANFNEWGTNYYQSALKMASSIAKDYEVNFYTKGILHRDISGNNIMTTEPGKLEGRLIDFGTALNSKTAIQEKYKVAKQDGIVFYSPPLDVDRSVATTLTFAPLEVLKGLTIERIELLKKRHENIYQSLPQEIKEQTKAIPPEYSDRSDIFGLGKVFGNGWIDTLWLNKLGKLKEDHSLPIVLRTVQVPKRHRNLMKNLINAMTADKPKDRPDIKEVREYLKIAQLDYAYYLVNGKFVDDNNNPSLQGLKNIYNRLLLELGNLVKTLFNGYERVLSKEGKQAAEKVLADHFSLFLDPALLEIEGVKEGLLEYLEKELLTSEAGERIENPLKREHLARFKEIIKSTEKKSDEKSKELHWQFTPSLSSSQSQSQSKSPSINKTEENNKPNKPNETTGKP